MTYIVALLLLLWVFRPRSVKEDYPEIVDAIEKDLGR